MASADTAVRGLSHQVHGIGPAVVAEKQGPVTSTPSPALSWLEATLPIADGNMKTTRK